MISAVASRYLTTSAFYPRISNAISTGRYEREAGYESNGINSHIKGLVRNNPFFSAVSLAFRKGVIGLGLNIQSNTQIKYTDDTTGEEIDFDDEFEKYIRLWGRKSGELNAGRSNCEITGRYFFQKACRTMADEYASASGGFIIVHHHSNTFKYGYKFEIVPLSRVAFNKNDYHSNIINGIRINTSGEIQSIFIYKDNMMTQVEEKQYKHLTLVVNNWVDPMQYSGVSPQASVLEALEYIDKYKATEMEGASNRAENAIFIKTPYFTQLGEAQAKEELKNEYRGVIPFEITQYIHGLKRLDNSKTKSKYSYISSDEDVIELGKSVGGVYSDMWANETKASSAAVGLTASTTVGAMSSSYNEALRGVQSEEQLYDIYAQEIFEDVIREMIEVHLLNGLVSKNIISPPNYYEKTDRYRDISYLRRHNSHIDPVKSAKAMTENVLVNRTKTMKQALAENGVDEETYFSERSSFDLKELMYHTQMKKMYEEQGLTYQGAITIPSTIEQGDLNE